MRKNILYAICLLLVLTGCETEKVELFDTSYTALNVWVGTREGAVHDNAVYNYSYAYEEGSVTFYAQISGAVTDYDRTFRLEIFGADSAAAAPTVRTEDYVIPAGSIGGEYKVYFNTLKLGSPDLFANADGEVSFRVVPSDVFAVGVEKHQQFTVVLRNYLAKPANWDSANYPRVALSQYFGTYSRVKYQFMIEHLGLIDFEINYNAQTSYNETTNVVSASYAVYLRQKMQLALNDYNNAHDIPLTDEFGVPVAF
jgi:hypothetical protein